jgi:hypothetical protein
MAHVRTAADIGRRFREEKEYIERYVRFLRAKSTIHDQLVLDLNRILRQVLVEPLPERAMDRIGQPYTRSEMLQLQSASETASREVYQTILGHEQQLDTIPSNLLNSDAAAHMDQLPEWAAYLDERLPEDPDEETVQNVIRNAMDEYENNSWDFDDESRIPPDALKDLLNEATGFVENARIR